jgi:hypothetical protein
MLRGVDLACGTQTPGHQLNGRTSGDVARERDDDLLEVADVCAVGGTPVYASRCPLASGC